MDFCIDRRVIKNPLDMCAPGSHGRLYRVEWKETFTLAQIDHPVIKCGILHRHYSCFPLFFFFYASDAVRTPSRRTTNIMESCVSLLREKFQTLWFWPTVNRESCRLERPLRLTSIESYVPTSVSLREERHRVRTLNINEMLQPWFRQALLSVPPSEEIWSHVVSYRHLFTWFYLLSRAWPSRARGVWRSHIS